MSDRCTSHPQANAEPCGRPGVTRTVWMCVHEHIRESIDCAGHDRGYGGNCLECRLSDDGHTCALKAISGATL